MTLSNLKETEQLSIALAQLNPHLGNVHLNTKKLIIAHKKAIRMGADIIITPEMFLAGYPCDDLVYRDDFIAEIEASLHDLAKLTTDGKPAIIVGAPRKNDGVLFNSLFVLDDGKIIHHYDKINLPNYGVFDEKRNFKAGNGTGPISLRGWRLGLAICEDIWTPDICETLQEAGAQLIISLNASPFEIGKQDKRMATAIARMGETNLPIIYLNMVGGQDEVVFDGNSFALNLGGELASHLPSFSETVSTVTLEVKPAGVRMIGQVYKPEEGLESCYNALMIGIRDYVEKNNFPGVVLGLSGGIDSALVAVLAADALGADKVDTIMMPSEYTADISLNDAELLADNLGISYKTISIAEAMSQFNIMLEPYFKNTDAGIAEENIQSRLRGLTLMAYSNKFGSMVLATGNKSEYAAGYATLYGDMCGGYAPIKDVWKTTVFELCKWRNNNVPRLSPIKKDRIIPERIITRPPSAELRPDQQDTDSLPEYDVLDPILVALTEEMADIKTIISRGFDREVVEKASQLLFRAEYKRFQAAPGPKITTRAFGRDRRLPLTSGFRPAYHNR